MTERAAFLCILESPSTGFTQTTDSRRSENNCLTSCPVVTKTQVLFVSNTNNALPISKPSWRQSPFKKLTFCGEEHPQRCVALQVLEETLVPTAKLLFPSAGHTYHFLAVNLIRSSTPGRARQMGR